MKNKGSAKEATSDDFIAAAERAFTRVARKLRAENSSMKAQIRNPLKVPFGTAKFPCRARSLGAGGCRLRNAQYLTWCNAFEVEFEDGIAFLETHQTIRRATKIKRNAPPVRVKLERQLRSAFFVHYDNGQTAEVSWSFIGELPPTK